MKNEQTNRKEAADLFWDAIPPIWYLLRAQINKTAREEFDITGGQFHLLRRIKRGRTSVSDLADSRHISRPVVSRKMDSLVSKNLVTRTESPEDRRITMLELTEDGEKVLALMSATSRIWLEEQFGALANDELETIIKAFSAMTKLTG